LFLLGVGVTAFLFAVTRVRNSARERAEFARAAEDVATDVRAKLEPPLEVVRSIASFFDASEDVSRAEFKTFVEPALQHHPGIRALEWIPIVPASKREEYEARARSEGFPKFEFKEEGPGLSLITAGKRPDYLPIYYMEPPDPTALGFDVGANPFRRAPADRARETGTTVASERIRLVEDPPSVYSIAVFYPVRTSRAGGVRGFAAEVFRIKSLVGPAVESTVRQGGGIVLLDRGAPAASRLLFESSPGLHLTSESTRRTTYMTTFALADRSWSLTVFAGHAQQARLDAWPWLVMVFGLVISVLLALTMSASTRIYRLRREVRVAERLGKYTLVEKLGEGGMGVVYRAQHAMLRRATAIKLLPPGKRGADDIARFEREVQLTSQLSHPNTIVVYDYGRTRDGVFYYVMELIDGIALDDLVAGEGPLPAWRVVHILAQVCGALEEAHASGIVHRDIKPANLMLMERGGMPDFVKVLDFGLVKENAPEPSLSMSRGTPLLGTPLYISPEAILSGAVDGRADLYALGCVAYFLITGRTVFEGASVVEVCAQHLSTVPLPASQRTSAFVPPSLDALILRCLEKKPEQRPASAGALLAELRVIETELGGFDDAAARNWWQERGHALMRELKERRRFRPPADEGYRATVAIDSRRGSKTPP
jgi:serine/threonine-protein kinase